MNNDTPSLRVVDFSTHVSGPVASHLLAEMGANVIKVENPKAGDGNRGTLPFIAGAGMLHAALNAGTRSLAISTRSPDWAAVVEACARWADVVIVGARPKDAVRRGMDFATMQRANPRIVYCALSGFGDAGPLRDYTAHGQTMDALAGNVPVEWVDGAPQTARGWRSAGTSLAGVFAALGIMDAIYRRDHGVTHAQYVSLSIWATSMWWKYRDLTMLANTGEPWPDYTDFGTRHALYETADHRVVLIAPAEQRFWERFCDLTGLPAAFRARGTWEGNMDCGEGPAYADERPVIAAIMRSRTLDEWTRLLAGIEIPFAPVLTPDEALHSGHAAVSGILRQTSVNGEPVKIVASPIRNALSDRPVEGALPPLAAAPGLGEHNAEILRELGLAHLAARS